MSTVLRSHTLLNIDDLMAAQTEMYGQAVRRFKTTKPRNDANISMVIPAYNEESRLLPTLLSVIEYFNRREFSHEIIVVDDGSSDATAEIVRQLGKRFDTVRLIRLPRNMGKGAAVRTGIRNATGQYVIYNDADGATPVGELDRLLSIIREGADVAIGSRALYSPDTRVERKLRRFVAGRIFAFLVNTFVMPGILDTQCGFKMFRKHAAQRIFEIQQLNGFAFDIEVLRIAWLLGYRIIEVPVNWTDIRGSKVNLLRDSWRMFCDVFRVRYVTTRSLKRVNVTEVSGTVTEKAVVAGNAKRFDAAESWEQAMDPGLARTERVNILGYPVTRLSIDGFVTQIEKFIRSRKPHYIAMVNAAKLVKMRSDKQLE